MRKLKTSVVSFVCLFLFAASPISASDIEISSYQQTFGNLSSTFETPHDLWVNEQFGLKKPAGGSQQGGPEACLKIQAR